MLYKLHMVKLLNVYQWEYINIYATYEWMTSTMWPGALWTDENDADDDMTVPVTTQPNLVKLATSQISQNTNARKKLCGYRKMPYTRKPEAWRSEAKWKTEMTNTSRKAAVRHNAAEAYRK